VVVRCEVEGWRPPAAPTFSRSGQGGVTNVRERDQEGEGGENDMFVDGGLRSEVGREENEIRERRG